MNLFKRLHEYKHSKMRKEIIIRKKWFIFRWETGIIVFLALIAALLNMIPNWVVILGDDGTTDSILSYPLRDNIVYSSISMGLTIAIAIFIGVYTEIGGFAGKFGSAIFVLVPSFVWLLSDRADKRLESVLDTAKNLSTLIFWVMMFIMIAFVVTTFIKQVLVAYRRSFKSRIRIEFLYNYVIRFTIAIINILIVLMLGYALVNYGVFTLNLAKIPPAEVVPDGPLYNFGSDNMVIFIALVATTFAILMVAIGLSNLFVEDKLEEEIETAWKYEENKKEVIEKLELTKETRFEQEKTQEFGIPEELLKEGK